MYKQLLAVLAVIVFITGCKKENDAQKRYDEAKTLYENKQFLEAKSAIDSIHILYPREVAVRRQALSLKRLVERGECERNIAWCDSLLPIRISELDAFKKGFIFEKNLEYDKIGNYIWSAMTIERNIQRSYIRCGVNEEGEMYVASVYFGSAPINHTGLSFSASDGTHAETPSIPYDGGVNYRFKDNGNTTEIVNYKGENCKAVANYIMIFSDKERIKATYTGGKTFSLYLTDADKKAFRATYELASVLNDIYRMQKDKTKMELTIMLLDQKQPNSEP